MDTTTLPVEVLGLITEALTSDADLYTLLFVSREFRYEAERLLYHTIDFRNHNLEARFRLFQHLTDCPRVAVHVRDLSIRALEIDLATNNLRPTLQSHTTSRYWVILQGALRAVINLKILDLDIHPTANFYSSRDRSISPLSDCTFRLSSLRITGVLEVDRSALEQQTQVEYLDIRCSQDITFSQGPFEKLSVASINQFELWRGNIKALRTTYSYETDANNTAQKLWTRASGSPYQSVVSLHLTVFFVAPDIATHFPSLLYLCLILPNGCPQPTGEFLMSLKDLSQLQRLVISGRKTIGLRPWLLNLPYEVATLERIVIGDLLNKSIIEWVRGAEDYIGGQKFDTEEWKNCRWFTSSESF